MAVVNLSERQRRGSILAVTTIVFVDALGFALVLPILPVVASNLFGASKIVIGILIATFPFFQLIAAPYLGRVSDVQGRRPVLVLTMLGAALGFALMALAEWTTVALDAQGVAAASSVGLALLFVARAINGLTGANLPVAQAYLADMTTPEERAEAMGGITIAFALAYGIGPAVAGAIAGENSLLEPALLGCGIALLGTLLVWYLLPESRPVSEETSLLPVVGILQRDETYEDEVFGEQPAWNVAQIRAALRTPATGSLLMQWFLFILCFAIFAPMFSLIAADSYGLTTRTIGLMLSSLAVLAILWQVTFLKPISARFGDFRLTLFGLLAFLGCFILLAVVPDGSRSQDRIALGSMMLLFGLGFAAARPAITSALSRAVPEDQVGGIMGVSQSLDSAATVVGPVLAGLLLHLANVHWLGAAATLLAGAAVLLNLKGLRDGHR